MACCGGGRNDPQSRLLDRVRALVDLPEGAMIWAATDGRRWRIVDRSGVELDPPVGSRGLTTALLGAPYLVVTRDEQGVLISAPD